MRTFLFCLTVLLVFSLNRANAQFEYIFPSNGTINEFPYAHIILRNGELMDPSSVTADKITLSGSKSGTVPPNVVLSTDGKTVCVTPVTPFDYSETVTVNVKDGLKTLSGKVLTGTSFHFSIRREMTEQEQQQLQEYLSTHDDDGNLIHDPNQQSIYVPDNYNADVRTTTLPYIKIYTNNNPAPGKIFFNRNSGSLPQTSSELGYGIIGSNGDSVFYRNANGDGINFHINLNGQLTAFRLQTGVDTGTIVMDDGYNILEEVHCKDGLAPSQHEQQFFPDGTKWFSCYDWQAGWDLSSYGGSSGTTVNVCWIQELDANNNVIFRWRADQFFLPNDAAPDILLLIGVGTYDPWHLNSMYLDNDGNMIASFRNMDRIIKINKSTGLIKWQWCGLGATIPGDFTTTNDPNGGFSHMHHVHRIENGHILMFDNGNLQPSPNQRSQPKEYILDEVNLTANCVWYYTHPQVMGQNMYTNNQGSAFRLPNGNTIMGYGLPKIQGLPNGTEIDANKNIVWEFRFKDSTEYSYRVYKAVWDPHGVGIANVEKESTHLQISPNPGNGVINVNVDVLVADKVNISVLNLLGQTIFSKSENYHSGTNTSALDLTNFEKGFYILQVTSGDTKMIGRILIQ